MLRSRVAPPAVGALFAAAGCGWLTFLAPRFAAAHLRYVAISAAGELVLTLWLLTRTSTVARGASDRSAPRESAPGEA